MGRVLLRAISGVFYQNPPLTTYVLVEKNLTLFLGLCIIRKGSFKILFLLSQKDQWQIFRNPFWNPWSCISKGPPCFPFFVAGGFLGAWHCVWKYQPCPSHSALWPHAIWALAPWPAAWELEIKIKTPKVNIASTIDIALAFQARWDNMASCWGRGGFLCWAGAVEGVRERTGGHEARKPGFVQPSLSEQTLWGRGNVYWS